MTGFDAKAELLDYLQGARETLLWKLDGLGEYDIRRPLTPTGTNLLGLVKHQAGGELIYFGDVFGRPHGEKLPWLEHGADESAGMWATPEETRASITGLYRRAWQHANATIAELPLDATATVPWWGGAEVTLGRIMVHMTAETQRHAGHADIVRELVDGSVGLLPGSSNMPSDDPAWWRDYRDEVERAARAAGSLSPSAFPRKRRGPAGMSDLAHIVEHMSEILMQYTPCPDTVPPDTSDTMLMPVERLEARICELAPKPPDQGLNLKALLRNGCGRLLPLRCVLGPGQTRKAAHMSRPLVAILTGAGVSTDSGIPDYRGPRGLWTLHPEYEKLVTFEYYMTDRDIRCRSWQMRRQTHALAPAPNAAHRAIAELDQSGAVALRVITQNTDGLHQQVGLPARKVLELHGTSRSVVCTACGARSSLEDAFARIDAGEPDPPCVECGGILKTATVMFGENLDPSVLSEAASIARACTVFFAVGTTLQVYPAAGLVALAADSGARLVIVNAEPTPYDTVADTVVREPIGEALPRLLRELTSL